MTPSSYPELRGVGTAWSRLQLRSEIVPVTGDTSSQNDGHSSGYYRVVALTALLSPADVFVHPPCFSESNHGGHGMRIWTFAHGRAHAQVDADYNVCVRVLVENGGSVGYRVTVSIFEGVHIGDDVVLRPGVIFSNGLRPWAHIKRHGAVLLPTSVRHGPSRCAGDGGMQGHDWRQRLSLGMVREYPRRARVRGLDRRRPVSAFHPRRSQP